MLVDASGGLIPITKKKVRGVFSNLRYSFDELDQRSSQPLFRLRILQIHHVDDHSYSMGSARFCGTLSY
jgi:hypothetical protein